MKNGHKHSKILAFTNHKGGVGKTTSVANIGASLARKGLKVLMIDLDAQANLSISFGLKGIKPNIYNVLIDETTLSNIIQNIHENLDIAPANIDLAAAEMELSSEPGREFILKRQIETVADKYDYILIDCGPSIGLLTWNALAAAHKVYIPIEPEYLALEGMSMMTDAIARVQSKLNSSLEIGGVFVTKYDARKVLNREIIEALPQAINAKILKTKVRSNIAIAEAQTLSKDIFRYNPKAHGAKDYNDLSEEILKA